MNNSPLSYPYYDMFSFISCFSQPRVATISPAMAYLAFRKIPENPVITPTTTTQIVTPSSNNRFLQTVTIEAVTPTTTA